MAYQLPVNVPQFLFDDSLISHHKRLVRRWLSATVFPEPVVKPDRPSERILHYASVLPHPQDGYRMYYWNFVPPHPHTPMRSTISLAVSRDGFHWTKPDLGVVEWEGSRRNNVVIPGGWHMDGPNAVCDPGSSEPYKMALFHIDDDRNQGVHTYTSVDGLKWNKFPGYRLLTGDHHNVMPARVNGKWVMFARSPDMFKDFGRRVIYRSESDDFLNWTQLEFILAPDLADEPDVEFYGLGAFERNGWYIGMLEYWDSLHDVIETHIVVSRDTKNWIRTVSKPFIGSRYDWNRSWSICANTGPIIMEEQMVFYFNSRPIGHSWNTAQKHGAVGLASLELDRFCALEGTSDGFVETVPMVWPGGELFLNADSRGSYDRHPMPHKFAGQIEIEVLDAQGKGLPDFSGDNRVTWQGNTHCREHKNINAQVTWPGERKLDTLKGRTIRLRFLIKHARLFTFAADDAGGC